MISDPVTGITLKYPASVKEKFRKKKAAMEEELGQKMPWEAFFVKAVGIEV